MSSVDVTWTAADKESAKDPELVVTLTHKEKGIVSLFRNYFEMSIAN